MKQNITEEQFNELSEKGKERLKKWVDKNDPLSRGFSFDRAFNKFIQTQRLRLSLGQMIEFLELWKVDETLIDENKMLIVKDKWCDALWEAVKEVLK